MNPNGPTLKIIKCLSKKIFLVKVKINTIGQKPVFQ